MSLLLYLSLRGSAATLAVLILNRTLSGRVSGSSRRFWWIVLPLAFLVPLRVPDFSSFSRAPLAQALQNQPQIVARQILAARTGKEIGGVALEFYVWMAGALAFASVTGIQTVRASRRWSKERFSTEASLLRLLEACKAEAGVTAPIGLVVANTIPSPAIMGWFRPRILLPDFIAKTFSASELRPIFLHELAHFRSFDVPFNWLLMLVRTLHWFNPVAHIGLASWSRFREEAADESAVTWMHEEAPGAYGKALISSLRASRGSSTPFGSFAIVESLHDLKRRITMINRHKDRAPHALLTALVALILAAIAWSIPARAADAVSSDPKVAAAAPMQAWLKEMDGSKFLEAWIDTTTHFREYITTEQWLDSMSKHRGTLGKCLERRLTKAEYSKDPHWGHLSHFDKGEFVDFSFDCKFEGGSGKEVVSMAKLESDGPWRVDGYSIDGPKP